MDKVASHIMLGHLVTAQLIAEVRIPASLANSPNSDQVPLISLSGDFPPFDQTWTAQQPLCDWPRFCTEGMPAVRSWTRATPLSFRRRG